MQLRGESRDGALQPTRLAGAARLYHFPAWIFSLYVEKPAKAADTSAWARRRLQQAKTGLPH